MTFLAVQIAAYSCWLVAVSAQTINAADAEALNQTLTGLGCWQLSACQTKNFSCGAGRVVCNAGGSVTTLYDQRERLRCLFVRVRVLMKGVLCEIDRYLYNYQLNGTISTFIGQLTALTYLSVTILILSFCAASLFVFVC